MDDDFSMLVEVDCSPHPLVNHKDCHQLALSQVNCSSFSQKSCVISCHPMRIVLLLQSPSFFIADDIKQKTTYVCW